MLINEVNCKNCGAPLHYNLKNRKARCSYCDSEYHLDDLGRVKEYIVEIEIFGKREKFYIANIDIERLYDEYRSLDGCMRTIPQKNIIKLELISY
mgnify:CR=1 FL=1